MDAKDTWPVVKFLVAATGLKTRDARKMLGEMPSDRFSQLFIQARAWDRNSSAQASTALHELLGSQQLSTLVDATRHAQLPSGMEQPPEPKKPKRRK
jgi:hypothetical protein